MPAATIHRCVAKKILEMTNLYTNEEDKFLFEVGCIAPDSWKNTARFKNSTLPKKQKRCYSHFSPKDKYIELYLDFYTKYNPKLDDPFMVGYLVHLMTDFFWRYLIFYNYFNKDGSIRLINGRIVNGPHGVRKTLLGNETMKIVTYLAKDLLNLGDIEERKDQDILCGH